MMAATLTASPVVDSSLSVQVRGALSKSHHLSSRNVHVATDGVKVRLKGTVGSFCQKQMAQEIVRRVDGIETVENQLQVSWR